MSNVTRNFSLSAEAAQTRRILRFSRSFFNEERAFLFVAVFVGFLSGMSVVCFRVCIEWARTAMLGSSLLPTHSRLLLAPLIAGVVVAVLVITVFPKVRGSGVNQTKAALYIYDGYIPFRTAIGKFLTSAIAIGGGHSLGPEDPSLQIGATLASVIGRTLKLSREKLRLIGPVGAAAGLAAAFNAPVSAVLFVIEEVIGRWTAGIFGALVLSAVSSVVVTHYFLGSQPLFRIPRVGLIDPGELLAYTALGIAGAAASIVFSKLIGTLRPWLKAAPRWTQFLQPAIAGLLIGLIGVAGFPQVLGAGYEYIDQAMHNQFPWEVLGILAGLKILATTLSFSSGTPGGMFAPTLFIGAMLGGAVGGIEHLLFPHLSGPVSTYALVGMGVMFAGFLRAPMTSVFMVLEASGDYSIVLPVIVANTLSYLIARQLQPRPIFEVLTEQDGLDLPSMEEQREEEVLRVEDAMTVPDIPVVEIHESARQVLQKLKDARHSRFLVDDRPAGWTLVEKTQLLDAATRGSGDEPLSAILGAERMSHLYPDNRLDAALQVLAHWPVAPVVHRVTPHHFVGLVSMESVMKTYAAIPAVRPESPEEVV